jgi:30S ribosomal protein S31
MGKGDKRSRKGKIFKGSYGKVRAHRVGGAQPVAKAADAATAKKVTAPKKAK